MNDCQCISNLLNVIEGFISSVEAVLDDNAGLNDIEEFIFRECWQGKQSYEEMAKNSPYDSEYIKSVGAKLWRKLSKAKVFGEKVKKNNLKSVIRRYLQRHKITSHQNQIIGVNLSGTNLSVNEANLCQTDLHELILLANGKKSVAERTNTKPDNQQIKPYFKNGIKWNDLDFNSQAEVKIAEALDRANIIFLANTKIRLTTPIGRENKIANFVILHAGKLGILQTNNQPFPLYTNLAPNIRIIQHYDISVCLQQPDKVVAEFLDILNQG
ncbi:hypothetical protein ACP6PL_17160 [Dapis sp. BLCC M126]|uniref:hypothetical protein n=1 Tax=Dapis sp. BLCC M126 TaxID=3400189 RepID=UPI003CEDF4E0